MGANHFGRRQVRDEGEPVLQERRPRVLPIPLQPTPGLTMGLRSELPRREEGQLSPEQLIQGSVIVFDRTETNLFSL